MFQSYLITCFLGTSTFSPVLLLPSISLAPTKHEIIKQKSSRQRPRDISRPLKVRCVSKGKNFPPIYVLCTYIGRLISLVYETKSSQTEVPNILEGSYSNEGIYFNEKFTVSHKI